MAIKTFNVNEETYRQFSSYCKNMGISMSKQVDMFMKSQIEDEPSARDEYLRKLDGIRKGKFIKVKGSLMNRY